VTITRGNYPLAPIKYRSEKNKYLYGASYTPASPTNWHCYPQTSQNSRAKTIKMADEREPLLSYHEVQRERTEQLLAHEITASAQANEDYPIDHGKVAWMQVLGGFILFANSW
jgi:hypothetical protein